MVYGDIIAWKTVVFGITSMCVVGKFSQGKAN